MIRARPKHIGRGLIRYCPSCDLRVLLRAVSANIYIQVSTCHISVHLPAFWAAAPFLHVCSCSCSHVWESASTAPHPLAIRCPKRLLGTASDMRCGGHRVVSLSSLRYLKVAQSVPLPTFPPAVVVCVTIKRHNVVPDVLLFPPELVLYCTVREARMCTNTSIVFYVPYIIYMRICHAERPRLRDSHCPGSAPKAPRGVASIVCGGSHLPWR